MGKPRSGRAVVEEKERSVAVELIAADSTRILARQSQGRSGDVGCHPAPSICYKCGRHQSSSSRDSLYLILFIL